MLVAAVGNTPNLATHLQCPGEPGTILLSEAVSQWLEGYLHIEAVGPIQVKGQAIPVRAY